LYRRKYILNNGAFVIDLVCRL